jgi:hypothetical protein
MSDVAQGVISYNLLKQGLGYMATAYPQVENNNQPEMNLMAKGHLIFLKADLLPIISIQSRKFISS